MFTSSMKRLSWDDLRVFMALIQAGNVRMAAQALAVSHSTVARRVEELEKRVKVKLFDRTAEGYQLTDAGQLLYDTARQMADDVQSLERHIFGRDTALAGPVVLSMIDALAVPAFLQQLQRFQQQYPQIELQLDIRLAVADLDKGEADLALRFGGMPAEHLVGRPLLNTARAVYLSRAAYQRYCQGEQTLSWISFTPVEQEAKWKSLTPFANVPTALRVDDMRTQKEACGQGLGLALLPCFLCEQDNTLVRVSEPDFPRFQKLWLVKHTKVRENARVKALTDFLVNAIDDMAPMMKGETGQTYSL